MQIGGIGKVTEQILKNVFGITTCEEMLQKSSFLCALFSRSSSGMFLFWLMLWFFLSILHQVHMY